MLGKNIGIKIFSIVIAIVIWVAVYRTTITTQEYYIDFDISSNIPNKYEVIEVIPDNLSSIKVKIWGNREILQREVTEASFQARLEHIKSEKAPKISEGKNNFKVIVEPKIRLPKDEVFYSYEPDEIQIILYDKEANVVTTEKKRISLDNISINTRKGFVIKTKKSVPKETLISSTKRNLNRINYVITEYIELNDVYKNISLEADLKFLDENLEATILEPANKKAKIIIEIVEKTTTLEFRDIEISYINLDESLSILNKNELKLNLVSITGSSSTLSDIDQTDIKPYIDLAGMTETGERIPKDIKIDYSKDIDFDEISVFYSPQTIHIDLIPSYEENIQELGKSLFSKNVIDGSLSSYSDERPGIILNNETNEIPEDDENQN